ncbi:hypothetical protein [Nostoc sp. GT001]|uniref:hypothetical protein n=1 Tax=Nostoc sp. GT001 TaxID=3056647 RepID=UPI0025AB18C0|nr:hypothetical protein [Nostoc sp. GT001]MDM9584832.1 hypothetical protein [Nostoc sp. GT001]
MKIHRLIPVIVSSVIITIALNAQAQNAGDPVRGLQDLVNVRGRDGESILQKRGYKFRWAEKSDDSTYSFWTQTKTGRCISVRTEQGRYVSLVDTGTTADCDRGDQPRTQKTSNSSSRPLPDLVGARAGQAEGEVRRRGYTYRHNQRVSKTSVASFWVEGNSGKCVEIVTSNGRYQNIFYVDWHHCHK